MMTQQMYFINNKEDKVMSNNNTNTIIKIGKDDPMLGVIRNLDMHLEGSAYVDKVRPTAKYGKVYLNILLREIPVVKMQHLFI